MTRFSLLTSASLVALILAAPAAMADVTAEEIWQDWQDYMQSYGSEMTGTERRSGDTLTVSAVSMAFDLSSEDEAVGDLTMTIPELTFTENGDGTVSIGIPGPSQIVFDSADDAEEDVRAVITYAVPGFDMLAAGDAGNLTYSYSADELSLTLSDLNVDGAAVPREAVSAEMVFADVTGETSVQVGDLRTYAQSLNSGGLRAMLDFVSPEGSDRGRVDFTAASLGFAGTSVLPETDIADELAASLRAGFSFEGGFELTESTTNMAFDGPDGTFTANTAADSTDYRIAMSAQRGIVYDITQTGLAVDMLVPELPLPVAGEMDSARFMLELPVVRDEAPQDFGLTIELNDLSIADGLWAMFDPAGQLPRDPATVQLALRGMATVLFDYLDPDVQETIAEQGGMPAELESLELTNLVLRAAGAALTGAGAVTMQPGVSPMFGPLGTPVGQVDLRLEGGNGLMDRLVAMGLLPEEQAMGARMMLGLFARPGDGVDVLTSTIEINEQGHVLANGQRIQ